jgi:hypothetical protein
MLSLSARHTSSEVVARPSRRKASENRQLLDAYEAAYRPEQARKKELLRDANRRHRIQATAALREGDPCRY